MNAPLVGLAVTPTVVSTLLSHVSRPFCPFHIELLTVRPQYVNRKPLRQRPTAHLSYDEGLHLIRSFLQHASRHAVEELQAFTSQWVPHPQWVKVDEVVVPDSITECSAELLRAQLGPEGLKRVGGEKWWTWRKPGKESSLRAEWIEMRADHNERKRNSDPCKRVMLYVHGGAYFFGSVDEHRYQMQRHARKLKARVFAPRYRLAPQFPFPCGLQDCLAAYLYLLTVVEPSSIVLAGDSAGGGMVVSMLVTLRDRGVPMPAGAVLISPWVDLTHSFPSVAGEAPLDYIPQSGFHHKPSEAWPPPDEEELEVIKQVVVGQKKEFAEKSEGGDSKGGEGVPTIKDVKETTQRLSLVVDGQRVDIKEQIQMYTTNELLAHPLVSPVMQPTLGGLPPLLIMVGGGEILRDEQIYLAHKCANPQKYLPTEALLDDYAGEQIRKYRPTDVQLQVWDDLCHVAPTLSFTRPAKYMYRSVAQFGAWALARAQKTEIDIPDDDEISVISGSDSDREEREEKEVDTRPDSAVKQTVGRAGDALPPFVNHMVRQRITRHGDILPLPAPEELPGCAMSNELVGVIKQGPVRKWLDQKRKWDSRYKGVKARVHEKRIRDAKAGLESFGAGEMPPPSALAGRRKIGGEMMKEKKKVKSYWLSVWSLWGSKHDEMTVERERVADGKEKVEVVADKGAEEEKHGEMTQDGGAVVVGRDDRQGRSGAKGQAGDLNRRRSRRRTVTDQNQTGSHDDLGDGAESAPAMPATYDRDAGSNLLSPDYVPDTGVTGKRPRVDGIAMPFSIKKEAETASMITLNSGRVDGVVSRQSGTPRPMSPVTLDAREGDKDEETGIGHTQIDGTAADGGLTPGLQTPAVERPGLETFVTAAEDLPKANGTATE
jgi:acetyl esterase/lipase